MPRYHVGYLRFLKLGSPPDTVLTLRNFGPTMTRGFFFFRRTGSGTTSLGHLHGCPRALIVWQAAQNIRRQVGATLVHFDFNV